MRVCLCLLITLSCVAMLGSGAANAVDYAVPFADLLYQQWDCLVVDHWSKVDDHNGTANSDNVYTLSTGGVTDQYDAHIDDGTYSGPYDHMQQVVWARSFGIREANELMAYYHTSLENVLGIDTLVPCGTEWIKFTSSTEDPDTIEEFSLWGKRDLPAGYLRVDEIHVRYWSD